jgi:putative transposase
MTTACFVMPSLGRQLNASLNVYLRMCGFPHIRNIPWVWVGVIPLMGRRRTNWLTLDLSEA